MIARSFCACFEHNTFQNVFSLSSCLLQVWQRWPLCRGLLLCRASLLQLYVQSSTWDIETRNTRLTGLKNRQAARYASSKRIPTPPPSLVLTTPLTGHESNGCPLPRSTEAKQCYHCQGLGHVQADCPTLRLSGTATSGRCYNCGQPGHLAVRLTLPENDALSRDVLT
ncbi:hypothetical protein CI102_9730 [Trichoderma harzianum]|nr:hypothetical protein CI102_9730 [Trichoderma harzianum]